MYKVSLIIMLFVYLAGCTPNNLDTIEFTDTYTVISTPDIVAGDGVPVPTNDVVLTISGAINVTNVNNTLQFDMETLEQLGVIEYSVNDEQAEGDIATFQGVLLSTILAIADISEDATNLNAIALNDYAVDIPISDGSDYPVMIATSVNGERMSIERYGPTRIIYPYESFNLDPVIYDPRWIWQLRDIVVG